MPNLPRTFRTDFMGSTSRNRKSAILLLQRAGESTLSTRAICPQTPRAEGKDFCTPGDPVASQSGKLSPTSNLGFSIWQRVLSFPSHRRASILYVPQIALTLLIRCCLQVSMATTKFAYEVFALMHARPTYPSPQFIACETKMHMTQYSGHLVLLSRFVRNFHCYEIRYSQIQWQCQVVGSWLLKQLLVKSAGQVPPPSNCVESLDPVRRDDEL